MSRFKSPGSVQLLDSVGRLRPAEDPEGEAALNFALHLAMRGLLPKARESGLANPGVLQSVFFSVGLRHNNGKQLELPGRNLVERTSTVVRTL